MLGEEEKLEKNSGKKKWNNYNIQKAQFEKELKEKKEKELKNKFSNHITLYFMTYDLFLYISLYHKD